MTGQVLSDIIKTANSWKNQAHTVMAGAFFVHGSAYGSQLLCGMRPARCAEKINLPCLPGDAKEMDDHEEREKG